MGFLFPFFFFFGGGGGGGGGAKTSNIFKVCLIFLCKQ